MKKLLMLVVAGVIALGAMQAWAGGCCSKKNKSESCTDHMSTLNLTDEQKAKIADIEAACKSAGSDKAACTKAKEDIRAVLTDEQSKQWDEMCAGKEGSCHGKKSES